MSSVAEPVERTLRRACQELERALRDGQPAIAERWLVQYPALAADAELAVELIFCEYLARESVGPPPEAQQFLERFPQFRERLERLFQVDELLKESADELDQPTRNSLLAPPEVELPPADTPTSGARRYGEYELLERLGSGGMGVVYRAWQPSLRRVVALKRLRGGSDDPHTLSRFKREAETVARLQHPHIVQIFDIGEEAGEPYLALEYVAGGSLRDSLPGKPLPHLVAARLLGQVARAVHHAHERGIIHRDLKPANILLTEPLLAKRPSVNPLASTRAGAAGQSTATLPPVAHVEPKITDFGLAARMDGQTALTRSGQILGTVCYMSPEQAAGRGDWVKPALDVYSLGVVLYEMLTGRPPFLAETELDTLHQVLTQDPVSPRRLKPNLPDDLNTVCLKCLERDPARRYVTAAALADDIDRFLNGQSILARPAGRPERLMKWARRNPSTAGLVAVSVVAVVALVALAGYDSTRLRSALADAKTQNERAIDSERRAMDAVKAERQHRQETRHTLDALAGQIVESWLSSRPTLAPEQQAFLYQAMSAYAEFAHETNDNETDASLADAALASERVGDICQLVGDSTSALAAYTEAEERQRALLKKQPESVALARVLLRRGRLLAELKKWPEADLDLATAQTSFQYAADHHGDADVKLWLVQSLTARGTVVIQQGNASLGEPYLQRAAALADGLAERNAQRSDIRRARNEALIAWADVLQALGRTGEASDARRRAGR